MEDKLVSCARFSARLRGLRGERRRDPGRRGFASLFRLRRTGTLHSSRQSFPPRGTLRNALPSWRQAIPKKVWFCRTGTFHASRQALPLRGTLRNALPSRRRAFTNRFGRPVSRDLNPADSPRCRVPEVGKFVAGSCQAIVRV